MRRAIASATLLLLAVIVAALIVSLVLLPSTSHEYVPKSELSFPTSLYALGLRSTHTQFGSGPDTGDLRERVLLIYGGAAALVLLISASVLILVRPVAQTPDS